MVTHEDVILAVLGASAALAGLVLVFLGIVVAMYQSYPGDTPKPVLRRIRAAGTLTLWPFVLGTACVALSAGWLLTADNRVLYLAAVAAFFAQLGFLLLATACVTWRALWH